MIQFINIASSFSRITSTFCSEEVNSSTPKNSPNFRGIAQYLWRHKIYEHKVSISKKQLFINN